jgi:hypothetical protein
VAKANLVTDGIIVGTVEKLASFAVKKPRARIPFLPFYPVLVELIMSLSLIPPFIPVCTVIGKLFLRYVCFR